jgi:hypothetical protein
MTEDYINVYGGYAIKLLRLQNEMIQTFERYRRGNRQTVEVRHVHIHSGGQGVVGIINPTDDRDAGVRERDTDPCVRPTQNNLAKARRCGARTRAGHPCRQAAVTGRARCRNARLGKHAPQPAV